MATPTSRTEPDADPDLRGIFRHLLAGLADLQFRELVTPRMLPTIYVVGIALSGLLTLSLVVQGFRDSWIDGLIWLLLLGPALMLALVCALRISLEFLHSIFRLVLHVESLDDIAHRIHGQTEEIATDLPRIRFWRGFTRPRNPGA